MPYELFLALRYLRMRRGRRVVKLTAGAALVGIACGVAALVVALALANGFRDELRDKILRGTAHVTVLREGGGTIAEMRGVVARVRAVEGVTDAAPTIYEGALLTGSGDAAYTALRGVDADSQRAREDIKRMLVEGALDPLFEKTGAAATGAPVSTRDAEQTARAGEGAAEPKRESEAEPVEPPLPIIVGEELAARTGLSRVGDEGWLITGEKPRGGGGEFEPRATKARVAGVFRAGLYEYDSAWAYISLDEAGRVAGEGLKSAVVSVEVRDVYAAGETAARIRRELGAGWTTVDWREANRPLFAALELERRTVALIIMLILLVAALNITTTLALVVVERRADIAVLGALGSSARSVTAIFMIEGAILGLAGALAGVALGLAACGVINHFDLARLPADVYSISSAPLRPHLADVVWPALAAFGISLLATLYPALQAARARPAEALRYE